MKMLRGGRAAEKETRARGARARQGCRALTARCRALPRAVNGFPELLFQCTGILPYNYIHCLSNPMYIRGFHYLRLPLYVPKIKNLKDCVYNYKKSTNLK